MKSRGFRFGASCKFEDRKGYENERHGGHDEAENNVSGRLDAGLSRREFPRVNAADGAIAHDESDVGQRIKDGVGHGGEERKRARGGRAIDLEDNKDEIGDERALDRDLDLELIFVVKFTSQADVLVYWAKPSLDAGILILIVRLDLAGLGGLSGCGEGAAAIALARASSLDEIKLTG